MITFRYCAVIIMFFSLPNMSCQGAAGTPESTWAAAEESFNQAQLILEPVMNGATHPDQPKLTITDPDIFETVLNTLTNAAQVHKKPTIQERCTLCSKVLNLLEQVHQFYCNALIEIRNEADGMVEIYLDSEHTKSERGARGEYLVEWKKANKNISELVDRIFDDQEGTTFDTTAWLERMQAYAHNSGLIN
ncbi:hypothetical protein K2W90_02525 [Candidatus Babeliales bacterium]|nr:hypothetical protein [Candidatus Babeliales bacterium]